MFHCLGRGPHEGRGILGFLLALLSAMCDQVVLGLQVHFCGRMFDACLRLLGDEIAVNVGVLRVRVMHFNLDLFLC